MKKGDIVLVPFPFYDLSGSKTRPALVLVEPNPQNCLKFSSIIKLTKLVTLDKQIILGKLGTLHTDIIKEIDKNLLIIFHLQ